MRPYNYAAPGFSSLQIIRTQGLYIEGAPSGCTSVLTLLDLVKAYEHVVHQEMFEGAAHLDFNLPVLLFVLNFRQALKFDIGTASSNNTDNNFPLKNNY